MAAHQRDEPLIRHEVSSEGKRSDEKLFQVHEDRAITELGGASGTSVDPSASSSTPPTRKRDRSWAVGVFYILFVAFIWNAASVVKLYIFHDAKFDQPFFVAVICNSCYIVNFGIVWLRNRRRAGRRRASATDEEPDTRRSSMSYTISSGGGERRCPHGEDQRAIVHDTDPLAVPAVPEAPAPSSSPAGAASLPSPRTAALRIAPFIFLGNWTYSWGLDMTSVTSSTVICTTSCVSTYLLSLWLLGEQQSLGKWAGVLCCMAGNAVLALGDTTAPPVPSGGGGGGTGKTKPHTLTGDAVCFVSTLFYAAYSTLIAKWVRDPLQFWANFGAVVFVLGVPVLAVGCLITKLGSSTSNGLSSSPREDAMEEIASSARQLSSSPSLLLAIPPDFSRAASSPLNHLPVQSSLGRVPATLLASVLAAPSSGSFLALAEQATAVLGSPFALPTLSVLGVVVTLGLLDNVLSMYFWARGMLLTSPTVATVGLSVTIPLSCLSDWTMGKGVRWNQWAAAALVSVGFLLLSLLGNQGVVAKKDEEGADREEEDSPESREEESSERGL